MSRQGTGLIVSAACGATVYDHGASKRRQEARETWQVNQSSWIAGYIFLAFLVYITMRGELPKYLGFLLASPVDNSIQVSPLAPVQTGSNDDRARENFAKFADVAKLIAMVA